MARNVQKKVSEAVLQEARTIKLGGRIYRVAPPTVGTLIMASAKIAELPEEMEVRKGREKEDLIAQAKDFVALPEILAILILGAKKIKEGRSGLAAWLGARRYGRLTRRITESASPAEMREVILPMLDSLQLKDFFVVTTFLQGINMTKPTKVETQTEATASGL